MTDWLNWLYLPLEQVLLAFAFVGVYEGARRLATQGLSRWPALMVAVGLVVPVFEASQSLKVPERVRAQSVEQAALRAAEPPGGWEKAAMSPEDRTRASVNAAAINYLVSGVQGTFVDAAGHRATFNPSQEQMQGREAVVRDKQGAEDAATRFADKAVSLFAGAAAILLIGLGVGGVQRVKSKRRR